MKKIKLLLSAAAVALVAMFTLAPAVQAQTVASLTADPVFVEAAGEYALMYPGPHGYETNEKPAGPDYAAEGLSGFLNLRKTSIYGGSNEIQKNILSKFVLGV